MFSFGKNKNGKTTVEAESDITQKYARAYVIGDVHGCFVEMLTLLIEIKADIAKADTGKAVIVFLGDLIDRGPKSKEVLDFLLEYNPNYADTVFLTGNHEEVFLNVLAGHVSALQSWFEFGGRSCMRSYGVGNLGEVLSEPERLLARIQKAVPKSHVDFVSGFQDYFIYGNFLCVHAGIRPKVPLKKQDSKDMRWIREKFLTYTKPHPYRVIHGHTIVEEPEVLSNRIGIDTGTYNGGMLTAACIVGDDVTFLQVSSNVNISAEAVTSLSP